jgi:folate-binding protein YgfZ
LLLDVEPGRERAVREHLNRFLISEDAEVADVTATLALFSLVGPRARDALNAALGAPIADLDEHQHLRTPGGWTIVGTRLGAHSGFDILAASESSSELLDMLLARGQASGLRAVSEDALEVVRVEAGVPRCGAELNEDTSVAEAGLAERAISYSKGCYVGQEAVARSTQRGLQRRRLAGLRFSEGTLPATGASLFASPDKAVSVGQVTSAVLSPSLGAIGLAYLRRELLASGTELLLEDDRRASVVALPFPFSP